MGQGTRSLTAILKRKLNVAAGSTGSAYLGVLPGLCVNHIGTLLGSHPVWCRSRRQARGAPWHGRRESFS